MFNKNPFKFFLFFLLSLSSLNADELPVVSSYETLKTDAIETSDLNSQGPLKNIEFKIPVLKSDNNCRRSEKILGKIFTL